MAHELAGKLAPESLLIDVNQLMTAYEDVKPDPSDVSQRVTFGTSGHRGTSAAGSFNRDHIYAITQAIVDYRTANGIDGPLFMGCDSHVLSAAAQRSALEVLAANGVETFIQRNEGVTPTPVISNAILTYNAGREKHLSDGIIITPSHNPPQDGGFKYNPPSAGPADSAATKWIQDRANELMESGNGGVKLVTYDVALKANTTHETDFIRLFVRHLDEVIDFDVIRSAGLRIGADPLGGASLPYWEPIAEQFGLNIEVVNKKLDPQFGFMCVDHDGKIRMDCSSPYAMASLVGLKNDFDVAFGNDPDSDRHGIVAPSVGLLNPNHYLSVAIDYLFRNRPQWSDGLAVGKTLVSSSIIDRVVAELGRSVCEVPVGFKWLAPGLFDGTMGFGGEESAGASFLTQGGNVWSTDKDGIIMNLLAAEITARTEKDPGEYYQGLTDKFGAPCYKRVDQPATLEQKQVLSNLSPEMVKADSLAGEPITNRLTHAPGNGAAIGGLKITTENGWFAARPSGTEAIYKIYAESFKGEDHLETILSEAADIVTDALGG